MDALPIRPQAPHHARHYATQRGVHRAGQRPAHRGAVAGTAHAPHGAAAPAAPGDLNALAEQAAFDSVASARAEQQREMNVLRDLAMQQVKRDDQVMNEWIKLI